MMLREIHQFLYEFILFKRSCIDALDLTQLSSLLQRRFVQAMETLTTICNHAHLPSRERHSNLQ